MTSVFIWIVRETLLVKEKKNCKVLRIDYKPFLGCLKSFLTNLKRKKKNNQEEN